MKKSRLPLLLIPSILLLFSREMRSQSPDSSLIQFVESVPVGTMLDNPDIPEAKDVWKAMIDGAKQSLKIEEFYVSNKAGEPLEEILQSILDAGRRGVTVQIIADSRMYKTYPESVDSLGRGKNIAVRIIDYGKLAGGVQHSKFFIVDGEEVYLGSQNFDWRSLKHIHELGLRMRHPGLVSVYDELFDLDWKLAEKNDRSAVPSLLLDHPHRVPFPLLVAKSDTAWVTPTMSPRGFLTDSLLWDMDHIVRMIGGARSEADLQFLSYSPVGRDKSNYTVLEDAIKAAAGRGVRVRLIVADWEKGSPAEEYLKKLSAVPNVQVRFSVIPDWSGGYVPYGRVEHCKYICVDGMTFWLGTSNAEKSYFVTSRNVGVIIRNTTLASRLREIFAKSWNGPYMEEIHPESHFSPRKHGEN